MVGAAKKKRKLNVGRELLSLELDREALQFLEKECVASMLMNKNLCKKAQEIAPEPGLSDTFNASTIQLKRWKRRNKVNLMCGTNDMQKVPEDYKAYIQNFQTQII